MGCNILLFLVTFYPNICHFLFLRSVNLVLEIVNELSNRYQSSRPRILTPLRGLGEFEGWVQPYPTPFVIQLIPNPFPVIRSSSLNVNTNFLGVTKYQESPEVQDVRSTFQTISKNMALRRIKSFFPQKSGDAF